MRLLIFCLLVYLGYRGIKNWMIGNLSSPSSGTKDTELKGSDDIMIKDPFCGVYFSKSSGVHLNYKGRSLYFCSAKCRDEYLAADQGKDKNRDA